MRNSVDKVASMKLSRQDYLCETCHTRSLVQSLIYEVAYARSKLGI